MNVNQTDLLFQMMQMANQFAQSTLPAVGTGSETGKSDFQSLLEDKRAESGQTPDLSMERPRRNRRDREETILLISFWWRISHIQWMLSSVL